LARKTEKYEYCLKCAEEGLIVRFPNRNTIPWRNVGVPSRIEHLKKWHRIDANLSNYTKYFCKTYQELVEYLTKRI
jgi:hypothetical protein